MDHGTDVRLHDLTARLLGLDDFVVLSAGEVGGELEVLIETIETATGCRRCGVLATAHGRREHLVRDIPSAGRAVLLAWSKRLWRCAEPLCPVRTWSETHPAGTGAGDADRTGPGVGVPPGR